MTTASLQVNEKSGADNTANNSAWIYVAAVMFCLGWGGNQFTPLLGVYRVRDHYSQLGVDVLLGAYVLGLAPGLLIASALSDRYGRRPLLLTGAFASIAGSGVLALGQVAGSGAIFFGRLLSGVAVGIAMSVGTAWVAELSTPAFGYRGPHGTGPRRASLALTLGLGIGAGVAGVLAQWAPMPLVLPYLVQIALAACALGALSHNAVETRFDTGPARIADRLRVPAVAHRRFRWVVLPMAPWIFGSAAIAYAIVPQVMAQKVGHWELIFATVLTVMTLGTGVLVQPLARRLDDASTARAVFVSMVLMTAGIVASAITAKTHLVVVAVPVAVLLGAAFGIALVSGMLEVQRIARADELAGLTGVYYALAYIGFLLPATLAGLAHWFSYPEMLIALAVVALGCAAVIGSASTKHLPCA